MARSINVSSIKSQMRQAQRKAERQLQTEVNKVTRKLESELNQEIRKYNSQLRHNQQIVTRELNRLSSRPNIQTTYRTSLNTMQRYYTDISDTYQNIEITPEQGRILDLVEREQINGLVTANVVENGDFSENTIEDIEIGNKLQLVSEDLNNRWKGAVFALSPQNPDAARHFCTSAREIFTEFVELKAPDAKVFDFNPNCQKTDRGNATRREKIKYMMRNVDTTERVIDFAEADITNILELFHVLSDGTHGEAGRYEFNKLLQVKKRVEQGINFLCEISA
ncbi:MAG: hypothetical protein IJ958_10280 [Agathobacter sp.]|nr:hypothetical protein [Agathobacter sp.]